MTCRCGCGIASLHPRPRLSPPLRSAVSESRCYRLGRQQCRVIRLMRFPDEEPPSLCTLTRPHPPISLNNVRHPVPILLRKQWVVHSSLCGANDETPEISFLPPCTGPSINAANKCQPRNREIAVQTNTSSYLEEHNDHGVGVGGCVPAIQQLRMDECFLE